MHSGFGLVDLKGNDSLGDLNVVRSTILKWIVKKCDGMAWSGLICSMMGPVILSFAVV